MHPGSMVIWTLSQCQKLPRLCLFSKDSKSAEQLYKELESPGLTASWSLALVAGVSRPESREGHQQSSRGLSLSNPSEGKAEAGWPSSDLCTDSLLSLCSKTKAEVGTGLGWHQDRHTVARTPGNCDSLSNYSPHIWPYW